MTIQKISAIASAALLAGGLLAGAVAQAQPGPYNDPRGPMVRPEHRPPPPPVRGRHMAPPPPPIAAGHRLPHDYRGYNYRVNNWQHYHLQRPRRGQYWVQYGPRFLLVNSAGIVVQVFVP
jgi:Ni/Co efflux regulator RcnB